tara:strand:+ start:192 stop:797 length:606 start_codon:yes stop_codon:yes gene_type:complete
MIIVVDYGLGNLGSVENMLRRIDVPSKISSNFSDIASAKKIILPGVGAFDAAMVRINESGLRAVLDRKALEDKVPILGVCLGMQLLTEGSEEGSVPGLGWIKARTKRFPKHAELKVPHMGWNTVRVCNPSDLTDGFDGEERFYFVHSYYVSVDDEKNSILRTKYGTCFDSGIKMNNIYGLQFHPEKSHKYGMKILSNFARI